MNKGHGRQKKQTSKTAQPCNKQEPSHAKQAQTPQENNATTGQIPTFSNVDPAPTLAAKTNEKWYQGIQGWKTALEIIAIFFGIAYAVITFFLWFDAHRNFLTDERPWITITVTGPPIAVGKEVLASTFVTNVGKTPARRIFAKFKTEMVNIEDAPDFDLSDSIQLVYQASGILFPANKNDIAKVPIVDPKAKCSTVLTQEDFNNLMDGKKYIATIGRVEYEDISGAKHWTNSCAFSFFAPNSKLIVPGGSPYERKCADFNNSDNN